MDPIDNHAVYHIANGDEGNCLKSKKGANNALIKGNIDKSSSVLTSASRESVEYITFRDDRRGKQLLPTGTVPLLVPTLHQVNKNDSCIILTFIC